MVGVDLVPEYGPLAVLEDGAGINAAALIEPKSPTGDEPSGEATDIEEDEDDI